MNRGEKQPGSAPPIRDVTSAEVERHTGLVCMVLNKLYRQHKLGAEIEWDDAYAVGLWAVWEALRRWESAKGKQSTYLTSYIWGYVMKYQRDVTRATGWHRTDGRIAHLESLDAPLTADTEGNAPTLMDGLKDMAAPEPFANEIGEQVRDLIARMPPNMRMIGEAMLEDRTVASCAGPLGVSTSRVGQIKNQVMRVLERELVAA